MTTITTQEMVLSSQEDDPLCLCKLVMSINYFNEIYDLLTDLTFCNFAGRAPWNQPSGQKEECESGGGVGGAGVLLGSSSSSA